MIMSIHIWTCCNWSPRASFGLYRCMYGHLGGCPQGMPKVIDHVQYLIFWGAQTLDSFMLSLNAVLVYGYPAHQVHGACCAYFARVLMCMGCLQFMSNTQCDVICIALAWLAYVLNLFYAFGPLYGYHHKTTKTQPNFDIFYHFWSCVNRTKACSKYMLFTTYFCIFGCLIPSYSADLLEKPKACEVGHVRKNPCAHERLRK